MANKPIVLIVAHTHSWLINAFVQKGYDVIYNQYMEYEDALIKIENAEGIIAGNRWPIDEKIIRQGKQLKWIGRLGSGMEKINVEFAEKQNIKCYSSPEGNCNAVAEHALGLLLALQHKIVISNNEVKKGEWIRDANRGTEINGKTIGIIGYGHTGSSFAKLLSSFNVKILVNDIVPKQAPDYVAFTNIETITANADIISFHLPLTKQTKHFANETFFNNCTKQPIIINTSRGQVIATNALIKALKLQQINGAVLDVLENENINSLSTTEQEAFYFLNKQENVIITPHIAGYSHEATFKMAKVLFEKIIRN